MDQSGDEVATLGEFGSLLQLGFGVGVGLSLFRAPMDLRVSALGRDIDGQLAILKGLRTDKARDRRAKLSTLKLTFAEQRRKLDSLNVPFMAATVLFAVLNLAALIWASLDAAHTLSPQERWGLLGISVASYAVLLIVLELVARCHFSAVNSELKGLMGRK